MKKDCDGAYISWKEKEYTTKSHDPFGHLMKDEMKDESDEEDMQTRKISGHGSRWSRNEYVCLTISCGGETARVIAIVVVRGDI